MHKEVCPICKGEGTIIVDYGEGDVREMTCECVESCDPEPEEE